MGDYCLEGVKRVERVGRVQDGGGILFGLRYSEFWVLSSGFWVLGSEFWVLSSERRGITFWLKLWWQLGEMVEGVEVVYFGGKTYGWWSDWCFLFFDCYLIFKMGLKGLGLRGFWVETKTLMTTRWIGWRSWSGLLRRKNFRVVDPINVLYSLFFIRYYFKGLLRRKNFRVAIRLIFFIFWLLPAWRLPAGPMFVS